jgi:SPFH domain/Band 7 family protein
LSFFLLGILLVSSARLVQQYEQGIVFRFGRILPGNHGPGLRFIVPLADRMVKVGMQTVVLSIPAQGAITRDNVTLTVDAVVYFVVIDPVKAIVNVWNYQSAVSQVAQTSLRSVIGRADLDTLLSDREQINTELKAVIDGPTEDPWGLHIERVEVKDISLPESMKRSMSRQAEAPHPPQHRSPPGSSCPAHPRPSATPTATAPEHPTSRGVWSQEISVKETGNTPDHRHRQGPDRTRRSPWARLLHRTRRHAQQTHAATHRSLRTRQSQPRGTPLVIDAARPCRRSPGGSLVRR